MYQILTTLKPYCSYELIYAYPEKIYNLDIDNQKLYLDIDQPKRNWKLDI